MKTSPKTSLLSSQAPLQASSRIPGGVSSRSGHVGGFRAGLRGLSGVVLAVFGLMAGAVYAQGSALTPAQQQAKATLEKVFACEQKMAPSEAKKLIKLLNWKLVEEDEGDVDGSSIYDIYNLPKQSALNLYGTSVKNVWVPKTNSLFYFVSEGAKLKAFPQKEVKHPDGNYKKTPYGVLTGDKDGVYCEYD
jgi:hypothetical protein